MKLILAMLVALSLAAACGGEKPATKSKSSEKDTETSTSSSKKRSTKTDTESDTDTNTDTDTDETETDTDESTATGTVTSTTTATATVTSTNTDVGLFPNSNFAVVVDVAVTALGTHAVPACPAGFVGGGAVADCGGGTCNGLQTVCLKTATLGSLAADADVVTGLTLTSLGTRETTAACANPLTLAGSFVNCNLAQCNGFQNVCKRTVKRNTVTAQTDFLTATSISALNAHGAQVPPCQVGTHVPIGIVADCGNGMCNGVQTVCQKLDKHP